MANISSAYGNLRISVETNSTKTFEKAVNLIIDSLWYGSYYTETFCLDPHNAKKDGKYLSVEDSFNGFGRWTYESNIENFGIWLEEKYRSDDESRAFLENLAFDIHYDFVDYEPGNQVFYQAEAVNSHQAGKPLSETMAEITNEKNIDFTVANAYKYEMEDPGSVIDFHQPKEDVKDFFVETFHVDPKLFDDEKTYQTMKDTFGDEWIWDHYRSDDVKERINTALEKAEEGLER